VVKRPLARIGERLDILTMAFFSEFALSSPATTLHRLRA